MKILNKMFIYLSALTLFFSVSSCEDDNSSSNSATQYVGLERAKNVEVTIGSTVDVEGKIYASESHNEDRVFNLVVDPSSTFPVANFTLPATVTIPAGSKVGTYQISVSSGATMVDGSTIVVKLDPVEGTSMNMTYATFIDGVVTGVATSKCTFYLFRPCASTRARLSIKFDNYPEETAWEMYDSNFNLIGSGGFNAAGTVITGYAALGYADRSTFSVVNCLEPGTYTFVIYDDYGDGMYTSSTISGTYSMNNLNNGATLFSGGGDFGASSIHEFEID